MIKLAKNLRLKLRMKRNHSLVNFCGEGAEIRGTIDKRHPQSQISVGEKSRVDGYVVTELADSKVSIGKHSILGAHSIIDCVESVMIGDNVLISYDVIIADSDNHSLSYTDRINDVDNWRKGIHDWSPVQRSPIEIKNGAWIGARAIILRGVTIGEGAIVGMGSVVMNDVPSFTIVMGNPARAVKKLPEEPISSTQPR